MLLQILRSATPSRLVRSFSTTKTTTGIYGLEVSKDPRTELQGLYSRIIHLCERFPPGSVLAQSAASIAGHRLKIVQNEIDISRIEEIIDAGQVEELIVQAQDEIKLLPIMLEHRVFDPLETPIPQGQWDDFAPTYGGGKKH